MADFVDGLVAFDLEAVQAHIDEMRPGGFIIFDNTSETDSRPAAARRHHLVRDSARQDREGDLGLELVRNTISLGVHRADRDGPAIVRRDVTGVYKRKGEKVVDINIRAIEAGEEVRHELFARWPRATRSRRASTATG
jgi:Pyruvate/2-oxoacid:ferredoxin oxidoreductase gamma subunit